MSNESSEKSKEVVQATVVRTVLQLGPRKEGVPTPEELYKALKQRSIELQSASPSQ